MDSHNASAADALRAIPEQPAQSRIVINRYRASRWEVEASVARCLRTPPDGA